MSCRAPGQERFTRLKTLGADYTEEAIRERIAGRRAKAAKAPREQRGVSLLIDIENSIKAAQSKGYEQLGENPQSETGSKDHEIS